MCSLQHADVVMEVLQVGGLVKVSCHQGWSPVDVKIRQDFDEIIQYTFAFLRKKFGHFVSMFLNMISMEDDGEQDDSKQGVCGACLRLRR